MKFLDHARRAFAVIVCLGLAVSAGSAAATKAPSAERHLLHLQGRSFDPVQVAPERLITDRRLRKSTAVPLQDDYFLVQFTGPITEPDKQAVRKAGAELLDYVPQFAFITRMGPGAARTVSALPQVRWVGVYQPAFRLNRELYAKHARSAAMGISETLELDILVFPGEDVRGVANAVRAVGGDVRGVSETRWRGKIRAVANNGRLTALANIPGVSWIESAPDWMLHNAVAITDPLMDVVDTWNLGFTGSTQIIAIADTQLDTGNSSTYVNDFNECSGSTPRVTISQLGSASSDTHSHGTHVAGSVLGNGRLGGSSCGNYSGYPAGAAPEADGYFQGVMNTDGSLDGIPDDLNNLFQPAHDFGARIHTNSWGSAVMGEYTGSSQEADQFSWDNKDFLIFYSAGNNGADINADGVIDLGSLGSPASAKNVMTVGASENLRSGFNNWNSWKYPVAPIDGDDYADNASGLAPFSSRGPTDDGRTKPDIVAPGVWIESVCSTQAGCSGNYAWKGGTSMSTPLTAGAAAVAREAYTALEGSAPSGAMLKALLANGATNMAPGQHGTGATQEIPDVRPTMQAGWGRVDLEDSLFPSHDVAWWDETGGLATNDSATYDFQVDSSSTPLAVTLAWSDYPGTPAAAGGLVNDLDLKLDGPGGTYYPNNAAQRTSSELLDPGFDWAGSYGIADGDKNATLLSPSTFPVQPESAKIWLYKPSAGSAGEVAMDVVLYDDDGSGSSPGTVLCTISGVRGAWGGDVGVYPVILSLETCPEITSSVGDLFLSVEFTSPPTSSASFLYAGSGASPSWYDIGSGWQQEGSRVYSFAAVVFRQISIATSFDRINNLVGIDLDSPPTGSYTLTVSGYNIPNGPQPYGLTLSGDVSFPTGTIDADLAVTKDNADEYSEIGGTTTYTVTVTNNGPDAVTGASLTDTLPAALTCSWTCTADGGGACTTGPVAGDISDSVDLPSGATATYTLNCDIDPAASGSLINEAIATVPGGVTDPNSANDAESDVDNLTTCGEANDVVLASGTVNDTRTITACQTMHAGNDYTVGTGGNVALEAGESVSFGSQFGVAIGGTLSTNVDPALAGN